MLNEFTVLLNIQVPSEHSEDTTVRGGLDITILVK
jgi:hypothetical protein